MPMTAPSFSRTTRAPGGSETIAAFTDAGGFAAAGSGDGGSAAVADAVVGADVAGATATVSAGRGIHDPRVIHSAPPPSATASATTDHFRARVFVTWAVTVAPAAWVNVVGFAGVGSCARRCGFVAAVARAGGVGRPVSAACTSAIVCTRSAGSLARHQRIRRSSSSGIEGSMDRGAGGGALMWR